VKFGIRENLTKGKLGGVQVNRSGGTIDNIVESEQETFLHIRKFLPYLLSNVYQLLAVVTSKDSRNDYKVLGTFLRHQCKCRK